MPCKIYNSPRNHNKCVPLSTLVFSWQLWKAGVKKKTQALTLLLVCKLQRNPKQHKKKTVGNNQFPHNVYVVLPHNKFFLFFFAFSPLLCVVLACFFFFLLLPFFSLPLLFLFDNNNPASVRCCCSFSRLITSASQFQLSPSASHLFFPSTHTQPNSQHARNRSRSGRPVR